MQLSLGPVRCYAYLDRHVGGTRVLAVGVTQKRTPFHELSLRAVVR